MKILYIGDIMGGVGVEVIEKLLPKLKQTKNIDLVIAQAENVSSGKGITLADYNQLKTLGVDFFTGGNWTPYQKEIWPLLTDDNEPIICPANYPNKEYGKGYKYIEKNGHKVLVISLLGKIVGKDADQQLDNPLKKIDEVLASQEAVKRDATVVNLHGDYSSEKVVIGHYLDGKVSAVVGDHWHVPTADARVLGGGTAHITDVGMCGVLDASLGVSLSSIIPRWRDNFKTRNQLATEGKRQFNAVIVTVNSQSLADSIEQLQEVY